MQAVFFLGKRMSLDIHPLAPHHRPQWQPLAQAYKAFYRTPTTEQEYDQAWSRLMAAQDVRGLGASVDGRLVGIAHFLHHGSAWADRVCYLQDLYTVPEARGQGVGRALIGAVAAQAREAGAARYYWLSIGPWTSTSTRPFQGAESTGSGAVFRGHSRGARLVVTWRPADGSAGARA